MVHAGFLRAAGGRFPLAARLGHRGTAWRHAATARLGHRRAVWHLTAALGLVVAAAIWGRYLRGWEFGRVACASRLGHRRAAGGLTSATGFWHRGAARYLAATAALRLVVAAAIGSGDLRCRELGCVARTARLGHGHYGAAWHSAALRLGTAAAFRSAVAAAALICHGNGLRSGRYTLL